MFHRTGMNDGGRCFKTLSTGDQENRRGLARPRFLLCVTPFVVLLSSIGLVAVDSASVAAATNVWSQMSSPSPNSQNVLFGPYCLRARK